MGLACCIPAVVKLLFYAVGVSAEIDRSRRGVGGGDREAVSCPRFSGVYCSVYLNAAAVPAGSCSCWLMSVRLQNDDMKQMFRLFVCLLVVVFLHFLHEFWFGVLRFCFVFYTMGGVLCNR